MEKTAYFFISSEPLRPHDISIQIDAHELM